MCLTQGRRLGVDVWARSRRFEPSPTTSEFYLQDPREQIRQNCEELAAAGGEEHNVIFLTPELQPTCSLQLSEEVETSIAANEPIEATCMASGARTGTVPDEWLRQ